MNSPEQKNKAVTLHKHPDDWPTEQDQSHAPEKKGRCPKLLPLEEEIGGPPGADDEDQPSKEEDLMEQRGTGHHVMLRGSREEWGGGVGHID